MAILGFRNKFVTGHASDAGLSSASPGKNERSMNSDGTFNVNTVDSPVRTLSDYYIALIRFPIWKFAGLLVVFLLLLNLFFTLAYYLIGDGVITGMDDSTLMHHFAKDFLFSFQSMTPVSLGISTLSIRVHVLVCVEVVIGLLVFAIVTGLIYGRFSRPNARLIHSKNALISPYKSLRALTFRVGNARRNQLVNIDWTVQVAFNVDVGNMVVRRYLDLKLEANKGAVFPIVWTVVHPINEDSPLLNFTESDFADGSLEINVVINGFDETFNQIVHSRFGYYYDEIIWRQKFEVNAESQPDGSIKHYLGRINNYYPVKLPGEA